MSLRDLPILMVLALWLGLGPGSVPSFPQATKATRVQLRTPAGATQGAILVAAKPLVHESPLTKTWGGTATAAATIGALPKLFSTQLATTPGSEAGCHSLQAQRVRWQI